MTTDTESGDGTAQRWSAPHTRRTFLRRGIAAGFGIPAVPAILSACGAGGATSPGAASASPKLTATKVTIALNGFENNITPFTTTFLALPNTNDLTHLVHDGLFWSQVDPNPEPFLAESAEPNSDRTLWSVRLRQGVTWHDGQPFTADDVKFTFEYYLKQPGASGRYAHHVSDAPPFDHAEIVDAHTIKMFYKAAAPTFPSLPGGDLPILPKHVWESITDPRKASTQLPVGTGPYKLVQIVPDQLYRFEANTSYFKGRPTVATLEMPIVKDPSAAFAALGTGSADMVPRNVPPELYGQFSNRSDIRILKGTHFDSVQLYFNCRKAPLTDAKLRKAISLAVDCNALVQTVMQGHAQPGRDTFLHPQSAWAVAGGSHAHDPSRAIQMLEAGGYSQKDSDGVRKTPAGGRLEFDVLISSFDPQSLRALQLVAQQVAPIGVKLNPVALDPATLSQRRNAPAPGQPPTYDAYVSGLETHGHADPDGLYYFFHSPGPRGFGASITGYSNKQFDTLSETASVTVDLAARKQILGQMQGILAQEAPLVVFYYPDGIYAFRESAYDGWISDRGMGIFTKRSFLPGYPRPTT